MEVLSLYLFFSAVFVFQHFPVQSAYLSEEQQKSELADSIKFALEQSNIGQSSAKRAEILDDTTKSPNGTSGISKTDTPVTVPPTEASTANKGQQSVETVQVIHLPNGQNLFTGIVQNIGTLNLNGVIMEAFKIAQVSLGLFAQQLAGSLSTTLAVPINSSAFIIPTQQIIIN